MSDLTNRIAQIAQELRARGQSPNLALVRARLGAGVNPVELLSAYQQWRSFDATAQQNPPTPPANLGDLSTLAVPEIPQDTVTIVQLQQQIQGLQQQISRLEQKIDDLVELLTKVDPNSCG